MSEFVRLTDSEHGVFMLVRKTKISCVAEKYDAPEAGAVVFIGDNEEGTRTVETLEYIMGQIDSPDPSLLKAELASMAENADGWREEAEHWKKEFNSVSAELSGRLRQTQEEARVWMDKALDAEEKLKDLSR